MILLVLCFTEHVIALEASDDFLTKRVQGLPESVAEEMRFTQDEFGPRLIRYRQRTSAEETLLDYFDELEIHPEYIGTYYLSNHNMILTPNKRLQLLHHAYMVHDTSDHCFIVLLVSKRILVLRSDIFWFQSLLFSNTWRIL